MRAAQQKKMHGLREQINCLPVLLYKCECDEVFSFFFSSVNKYTGHAFEYCITLCRWNLCNLSTQVVCVLCVTKQNFITHLYDPVFRFGIRQRFSGTLFCACLHARCPVNRTQSQYSHYTPSSGCICPMQSALHTHTHTTHLAYVNECICSQPRFVSICCIYIERRETRAGKRDR